AGRAGLARRAAQGARARGRAGRRTPAAEVARRAQRLATVSLKLSGAVRRALESRQNACALSARALESVSPLAVLARGYAIAHKVDGGAALTDASTLAPGAEVETRLARGSFRARVESVRPPEDGA